jgi:hypothetical protein
MNISGSMTPWQTRVTGPDATDDSTAKCLYRKLVFIHQALIVEKACKDTKPITALFRLTAVGVENSKAEIAGITGEWTQKNPV